MVTDLIGKRFARLTVIAAAPRNSSGSRRWLCKCDCGAVTLAGHHPMMTGATKSCGCYARQSLVLRSTKHGATVGGKETPAFRSWMRMRYRCYRVQCKDYPRYGGRGICVCDRWQSFENFHADMGDPPPGHSIDRVDSNGHYEPGNCRWATPTTQSRNRSCVLLNAELASEIRSRAGRGELRRDIARVFGVSKSAVGRVVRGEIWKEGGSA